jgi:hypothetical protein
VEHWTRETWLTLFGLIVIPIVSAWVGALLGGRAARSAGLEAQQKAATTERELRAEEREHERQTRHAIAQAEKDKARLDSARLTRRYVILARDQLQALVNRFASNTLAPAHVLYVQRTVGDFQEIKTRMIALEDDDVEEAIFQWYIVAMDHLAEAYDSITMQSDDYMRKYGVRTVPLAREAGVGASLVDAIGEAEKVLAQLEPFLRKPSAEN